jgi:hypothetical protein
VGAKVSKLRNFVRDVNRECDLLPLHTHPRRIRMNCAMFNRLFELALNDGVDITKTTWGNELPGGYDGLISDLPIRIDESVEHGCVQLDYDYDFTGAGI